MKWPKQVKWIKITKTRENHYFYWELTVNRLTWVLIRLTWVQRALRLAWILLRLACLRLALNNGNGFPYFRGFVSVILVVSLVLFRCFGLKCMPLVTICRNPIPLHTLILFFIVCLICHSTTRDRCVPPVVFHLEWTTSARLVPGAIFWANAGKTCALWSSHYCSQGIRNSLPSIFGRFLRHKLLKLYDSIINYLLFY